MYICREPSLGIAHSDESFRRTNVLFRIGGDRLFAKPKGKTIN